MKTPKNAILKYPVVRFAQFSLAALLSLAPLAAQTVIAFNLPNTVSTRATNINETGVIAGIYTAVDGSQGAFIDDHNSVTAFTGPDGAVPTTTGINSNQSVIGWYNDLLGIQHGFLRTVNGAMQPILPPNADEVYPVAVDDSNNVAGYFIDLQGATHGFVLNSGVYQNIDYPGAALTKITDQNQQGTVVGFYADTVSYTVHGFTWSSATGYTRVDYPGASSTTLVGIDQVGNIIGNYMIGQLTAGFQLTAKGTMISIAPSGYPSSAVVSVGRHGGVVGDVGRVDSTTSTFIRGASSFYRSPSGNYVSFSSPGTIQLTDCNSSGVAVGFYTDTQTGTHSFRVNLGGIE